MKYTTLILLVLISCKNPEATEKTSDPEPEPVPEVPPVPGEDPNTISAPQPKPTRNITAELYDQFFESSHAEQTERYESLKDVMTIRQKQGLLYNAIQTNNVDLTSRLINYLNLEGEPLLPDRLMDEIHGRWFPYEQSCDSVMIDLMVENLNLSPDNRDARFRLINAVEHKNYGLLKYYLDHGWSIYVNTTVYLDESGDASFDGSTPLDFALDMPDTLAANMMVQHGAEFNERSLSIHADSIAVEYTYRKLLESGRTPEEILDSCLWHPTMYGQIHKVKEIIRIGGSTEETDYYDGNTPIFNTIQQFGFPITDPTLKKLKIMKLLIESGANMDHQNKRGETPLMYTTRKFYSDGLNVKLGFAKLLLAKGANTELQDAEGNTFWDHVIINQNRWFMDYLIDQPFTPELYKSKYDSMAKVTELESSIYPMAELEEN